MKGLAAVGAFVAVATASVAGAADITGAGASFPAPLYATWAQSYRDATGIGLNYQAIGSGGGIRQIRAGTIDFGATDRPLTAAALAAAGLYQFPTVIGGVVPVVNLPGLASRRLRLSGPVLAAIFDGQLKRWNDPAIARLNRGLSLPAYPITPVHRSDGSGTTYLFTAYLSRTSPAWARKVGAGDAVAWRAGLGGKGNDGVSAYVRQTAGAIGYVEYAYARQNRATIALVRNRDGAFPAPALAAFAAAAASATWMRTPGNAPSLIDRAGPAAWPITGATYVLVRAVAPGRAEAGAVTRFFDWAWRTGDGAALRLGYVPLPEAAKSFLRSQWRTRMTAGALPLYASRQAGEE